MADKIATFEWLHTNKSNLIKVGVTMPNNKKGVTKSDVNTYLNTSTGFYYNKLNNQLLAQSEIWGNDINFLKVRDLIKLNNGKFLITGTFNIQSNLNKIAIINEETNSIDNDSFDLNYKFDGAYPDKVFKLQNGDLLFQSGHILDQNLNLVRKINFLGKIIRVTNDNKFFTSFNVGNFGFGLVLLGPLLNFGLLAIILTLGVETSEIYNPWWLIPLVVCIASGWLWEWIGRKNFDTR